MINNKKKEVYMLKWKMKGMNLKSNNYNSSVLVIEFNSILIIIQMYAKLKGKSLYISVLQSICENIGDS